MPNRVTDLESAVAHLQAAVDGLRGELVDANERIRALERQIEHRESVVAVTNGERKDVDQPKTNGTEEEQRDSIPASIDDIIVA